MTLQVFLSLLFAASIFTSLVAEGLKKLIGNRFAYSSNILVAITAVVVGAVVGIFYYVIAQIAFSLQMIAVLIMLIFLSWLSAMVGYDKVVQTITQIKIGKIG